MTLHPLQYTLTHTGSGRWTHSIPLYSKLDFFSSSLSLPLFSAPPFYSAGYSCLCQILSLFPSRPLSQSLFLVPWVFVFFALSSLLPLFSSSSSISLTTDYLFHCPLFFASFSQYHSFSEGLPSLFLCPLFSAVFTGLLSCSSPPLRPLTLYFPLAFLFPLFSFRSPFLLHPG